MLSLIALMCLVVCLALYRCLKGRKFKKYNNQKKRESEEKLEGLAIGFKGLPLNAFALAEYAGISTHRKEN